MTTDALKLRLATTATGYGAVIDGILNIRTVTDSPNAAALNALYVRGFSVMFACGDTDCDCAVKALARAIPTARIVAVKIEVEA